MFQQQQPFFDGYVENDAFEQVAIRHDLGVRSPLAVPFAVFDDCRCMLVVRSVAADHFTEPDLELLRLVAYWVALVAQQHAPNGRRSRGGRAIMTVDDVPDEAWSTTLPRA